MNNYFSANPPGVTSVLTQKTAFIAGAGGLGGNVAMMLVRAGIGKLIIADFDVIDASNMNRQFYFRDQVGLPKVDALAENLQRINPELEITKINEKLTEKNFEKNISHDINIIFECFDKAEAKAAIANFVIMKRADIPCITVSGLAGTDAIANMKLLKQINNLYLIGDGVAEMNEQNGTIASRVIAAAALQAHLGIKLLLG